MEVIYERSDLRVYDDFAHHPTEIATTLDGLRRRCGDDRIIAIIEPASHTMKLGIHEQTLLASADKADAVYWYQGANVKWDMSAMQTDRSHLTSDLDGLIEHALKEASSSESVHIVIMSNGSFMGVHQKLADRLRSANT